MCNSCISIFLAQVLGFYLFIVSLLMIVRQQQFKKVMTDLIGYQPLLSLTGACGVLTGLLILVAHNVWVSDWPILITIIGWFVLIQGLMRLFFPEAFVKMCKDMMSHQGYLIWSWVWLLIGLYLIWAGFSTYG